MRLWERNASGSARRAHKLVADYLGERSLAPAIQAAIEAAVADKLAWGVLPALDDAMSAAVDLYAEPADLYAEPADIVSPRDGAAAHQAALAPASWA